MAKDSIADLNIAIRATADKLSSDINRGMKGAQQSSSIGAIALGTAIGVSVVAGLGAAMAGVKKVVGLAFEGLDRIDALDEAASKIGITYNALQDLKFAAEMTGGSFEGMVSSLAKMQANISSGNANEALDKLGLSAEYLKQLAPEKQFAEINQKLSEIKNTGEKIDLTKGLYGKGGVELLNVINSGKDGLAEMSKTTQELGGHLTDAQRSMATMAQEDIEKLQTGWGYLKDQIAVAVAPALLDMVKTVQDLAKESAVVSEIVRNWPIYFVETVATAAEAVQAVGQFARIWKDWNESVKDNPFTLNPITDYRNSMEDLNAAILKNQSLEKNAGDVIREKYEKNRLASQAARLEALNAAREKKELDDGVANNKINNDRALALSWDELMADFGEAFDAQTKKNLQATYDFNLAFDQAYQQIPGSVKAALEEIVNEYTDTTKTLEDLLMSWIKATVGAWVDITSVIGSSLFTSAGALWSDANEILQSFGSRRKFGEADGQATLDSMRTNRVELSPAEAAMAKSASAREASQAREAARVSANRAESAAKSAERQSGIGGGMKIGSFDGSFTTPGMSGQAPSFFGGGGMRSPRMNTAAAGGTLGAVTINQSFSSGVTRAELAGSMDDLKDATLGAVLNAVSNGGGFRNALQA
jgi:hypothetical protein